MRKLSLVWMFVFLLCSSAVSHEHWIDLEEFYPLPGEKTIVSICSGHYFPKSSVILADRLLHDMRIISPDKKEYTYETRDEKNRRVAEVVLKSAGIHLISFSLKKPPVKEPLYFAKSIVLVGELTEDKVSYTLGCLIEIVPEKDISRLKKGEELPLRLLYKGKPATSTFSISLDGKENFFLRTNKDGLALLKVTTLGRYLITAHYKGKGCSLTFCIREFDN
ncbi:hypothetical protein ES702_06051 [subsurface metagenome]